MIAHKPIIIIPGLNGSLLINKQKPTVSFLGNKITRNAIFDTHTFLNVILNITPCNNYNDKVLLEPYDFKGINGIQNLVPQMNTVDEYLNAINKNQDYPLDYKYNYSYFGKFNSYLIQNFNYIPKTNLIGLPYDYRYMGHIRNRQKYYKQVKDAIENTYISNYDKPAIIIAHSLGGLLLKNFVSSMPQTWQQKYIDQIVFVNTPFGGVPESLFMYLSKKVEHKIYKNFSSILLCLPNKHAFEPTDVLIKTDNENITVNNILDFVKKHSEFKEIDSIELDTFTSSLYFPLAIPSLLVCCCNNDTSISMELCDDVIKKKGENKW